MKKTISLILAVVMLTAMLCTASFAEDSIEVYLNGSQIEFDVQPQVINDRTMVPMRKIFEALGADVYWFEGKQVILGVKNEVKIVLQIDSVNMSVLNVPVGAPEESFDPAIREDILLDQPPTLFGDRTLVPVRAISESFGITVGWDEENTCVNLTSESASSNTDKEFVNVFTKYLTGELEKMPVYQDVEISENYIEIVFSGIDAESLEDIVRLRAEMLGYTHHKVSCADGKLTLRVALLERMMSDEEQMEVLGSTIIQQGNLVIEDYAGNVILDNSNITSFSTQDAIQAAVLLDETANQKIELINGINALKINKAHKFELKIDGKAMSADGVDISIVDDRNITISGLNGEIDLLVVQGIINIGALPSELIIESSEAVR